MDWWGQNVLRFPWTLLLMSFLLGGLSLQYTINTLGVDTNALEMLSRDLNPLHLASKGLLLAIGITFTLLCSLIVLPPAFCTLWRASGKRI
jgi:hypothetical protein